VASKIVLISIGQPSVNPRVVKEADAFFDAGYDVTVLYCFFIKWALEKDELLLSKKSWKHKMVGGSPLKNKFSYNYTRLRFKIARILNAKAGNFFMLAERAQARVFDEVLREAKKIKADWYIGHNLGALAVAVNAAKYNNAKAGFDFEDYHRGETDDITLLNRYTYLENKYVNQLHYYSSASYLIAKAVKQNHSNFNGREVTLLNCFSFKMQPIFVKKNKNDKSLNLFWFSQTIGLNRGLEILFKALVKINNPHIKVTLAGRVDDTFLSFVKHSFPTLLNEIVFAGIIEPEELPTFAASFDVGLALEPTIPINRDICLTNKVFTYLLAGNSIIYSETKMQHQFNEESKTGVSFSENNLEALIHCIQYYLNPLVLLEQRKKNYLIAKNIYNWENESKKLLAILN
jgi:hypothetical protein